jgi:hypothetical protein
VRPTHKNINTTVYFTRHRQTFIRSCVDTQDKAEIFLEMAFNTNQSAGTLWNSLPANLRNEQSLEATVEQIK